MDSKKFPTEFVENLDLLTLFHFSNRAEVCVGRALKSQDGSHSGAIKAAPVAHKNGRSFDCSAVVMTLVFATYQILWGTFCDPGVPGCSWIQMYRTNLRPTDVLDFNSYQPTIWPYLGMSKGIMGLTLRTELIFG